MIAARRHLTQSQLAHAAAGMKDYEERKAKERQKANLKHVGSSGPIGPDDETGRTSERLAKKAGVGVTTIKRAIHVREKGTDELNAAVAAGEITVK